MTGVMIKIQNHDMYHLRRKEAGRLAMKVSKQKMAEHREQIIEAAAKRFRENGFDGISVAELMKEVGLTHGGFYGHFKSKEELVGLASQRAMNDTATKWEKVIDEASGDPLEALAKNYLSFRHQDHPESGCLFAALGSELGRQPASVKEAVMEGQSQFLDLISRIVPGRTKATRRKNAVVVFAGLIGGMILARSVPDPELSQEILRTMAAAIPNSVREAVA
jgi:TetR/AcrR family transcriptional regulator, transcriptional repressor for nem operon